MIRNLTCSVDRDRRRWIGLNGIMSDRPFALTVYEIVLASAPARATAAASATVA